MVAEWVEHLCSEWEIPHSNPSILPLLTHVGNVTGTAMPAVNRLAGVAPEVNLRSNMQARKHASNIHPGFETQGKGHQKSKTGVSVAPQKGHVSSKKCLKKRKSITVAKKSFRKISYFNLQHFDPEYKRTRSGMRGLPV